VSAAGAACERAGWDEVVALLESAVDRTFPAAALYCRRGGRPTVSVAVGAAELTTWFDLASLTKALCTSVLCMRLVEAGKLDLDEQVMPGVAVRALLRHTSGLPAWRPLFLDAGAGRDLTLVPGAGGRQAIVAAAAQAERSREPRAVYSDLGFILLGDFLEQRTGERLDAQFARLAAALGADIGFRPFDSAAHAVPAERCAPTRRESDGRELLQGVVHDDNARAMLGVAGHAGLFGTAAGVALLVEALLDVYQGAGTAAQQAIGVSAPTLRRFWALPAACAMAGPAATFGLGWDHPTPSAPGAASAAVSSAGRLWPRDGVGHLGYTGCSLWIDPGSRAFVILLSNRVCAATSAAAESTHAGIKALRPALHDAVLRAWRIA